MEDKEHLELKENDCTSPPSSEKTSQYALLCHSSPRSTSHFRNVQRLHVQQNQRYKNIGARYETLEVENEVATLKSGEEQEASHGEGYFTKPRKRNMTLCCFICLLILIVLVVFILGLSAFLFQHDQIEQLKASVKIILSKKDTVAISANETKLLLKDSFSNLKCNTSTSLCGYDDNVTGCTTRPIPLKQEYRLVSMSCIYIPGAAWSVVTSYNDTQDSVSCTCSSNRSTDNNIIHINCILSVTVCSLDIQ